MRLSGGIYTTLDEEILRDAARLTEKDIIQLQRPGFTVRFYDTEMEFYTAEALEYVHTWIQATEHEPTGICGPIGPADPLSFAHADMEFCFDRIPKKIANAP